jgi:hypothetical protein
LLADFVDFDDVRVIEQAGLVRRANEVFSGLCALFGERRSPILERVTLAGRLNGRTEQRALKSTAQLALDQVPAGDRVARLGECCSLEHFTLPKAHRSTQRALCRAILGAWSARQ